MIFRKAVLLWKKNQCVHRSAARLKVLHTAGPTCTRLIYFNEKTLFRLKTNTASDNDYSLTYSELGGSRRSLVETEHDDLQAVTAVGAFEEAWLQEVRGHRGRQVDPPVCQAVTVTRKETKTTAFTWTSAKSITSTRTSYTLIHRRETGSYFKRTSHSFYYCLINKSYWGRYAPTLDFGLGESVM